MAVKRITLRAWSDNSDVPPIKINQGDILSRTIFMTLLDSGGAPLDLTLSAVRVHFSKPDGKTCYLTASIVSAAAGIASVILDSQCTAVSGTMKSIVQVTGPNGENTFINGAVFTVGAINIEGSIISSNEFTALTDALKQVQGIANKADKSTEINGHTLAESFDLTPDDLKAATAAQGTLAENAIPGSDKGKAGGVAILPPMLPKTSALYRLTPTGSLEPVTFDDFALGYDFVSNANGFYEKRPDGVLECWAALSMTTDANGYATWTFPAQFFSTDNLYISPIITTALKNGGQYVVDGVVTSVSASSAQFRFLFTGDSATMPNTANSAIQLHAVGRWKQ